MIGNNKIDTIERKHRNLKDESGVNDFVHYKFNLVDIRNIFSASKMRTEWSKSAIYNLSAIYKIKLFESTANDSRIIACLYATSSGNCDATK